MALSKTLISVGKRQYGWNVLVNIYVYKIWCASESSKVLEKLLVRSIDCWNALIVGYAEVNMGRCWYGRENICWNAEWPRAWYCLGGCKWADADMAERIYVDMLNYLVLGTGLVGMQKVYFRKPQGAWRAFYLERWLFNALIAEYAKHGQGEEALRCFQRGIQSEGVPPYETDFICTLPKNLICTMILLVTRSCSRKTLCLTK